MLHKDAFGIRLKGLRTDRSLTLKQAGELIGIKGSYLWDVEAGARPPLSLQRLLKVREAYALNLEETASLLALAATDPRGFVVTTNGCPKAGELCEVILMLYDRWMMSYENCPEKTYSSL